MTGTIFKLALLHLHGMHEGNITFFLYYYYFLSYNVTLQCFEAEKVFIKFW
jgi:hypothetical protein